MNGKKPKRIALFGSALLSASRAEQVRSHQGGYVGVSHKIAQCIPMFGVDIE